MAQITYANKIALNENPEIADINKVKDTDMNEIKQVVNDNYNHYIEIQTTTPTDNDCKLFINPNESVNVYGNYISNSYGTSQEIGYSQEYVNGLHGVELFSGNTNGDVALSDNPTNYKLLFVKHKNYDSGIVYNDVIINPILNELYAFTRVEVTSNQAYTFEKDYTINADKLVAGTAHLYALHDGTYSTYNNIRVLSVIGYK